MGTIAAAIDLDVAAVEAQGLNGLAHVGSAFEFMREVPHHAVDRVRRRLAQAADQPPFIRHEISVAATELESLRCRAGAHAQWRGRQAPASQPPC